MTQDTLSINVPKGVDHIAVSPFPFGRKSWTAQQLGTPEDVRMFAQMWGFDYYERIGGKLLKIQP